MASKRIVTTDRSGLSLAQVGGNDVYRLLPQVQSVIELGNLGDEYVKLFAEPVDNGRAIDWYVEEDGDAVPLSSLDGAQRKALLDRFGEMIAKLQQYAGSLRKNPSDTYRNYADILEKALIVPDIENALYSVDGNPVLANWGFSTGDNEIVDGAQALMKDIQDKLEKIKDIQDKTGEAVETAAPAESPSEPAPAESPAKPAPTEDASGPTPAEQPSPPEPAPASGSSGSWIAAAITGAALLAAGAAAWYFFSRANPASDNTSASSASMAWLKGNLSARGVLIDENDEAVDLTLSFEGEDGRGKSIIKSENQTCTGQVVASQQSDNRIAFAMGELACPDGHNYEPFTMTCIRGQSVCTGTNLRGDTWELNVNLLGGK